MRNVQYPHPPLLVSPWALCLEPLGRPGAPHGHTQGELLDCGICELSRRGETDEAFPAPLLLIVSPGERPTLRISDVNSAPRAPTRGRLTPRAPPASV